MADSVVVPSARVGSPGWRTCCLFTPDERIFRDDSALDHQYGVANDEVGIIYTCNAGFIDIAHLRDVCDLTRYYYDQLKRAGGKKDESFKSLRYGKVVGSNGEILKDIPEAELLQVAGRLAYLESVFHEIESYWWFTPYFAWPGMHNSAFSPEDLVSNHLGAIVGMRAIQALEAGTFSSYDEAVTSHLGQLLNALGAAGGTRDRTLFAYTLIENVWFIRANPRGASFPLVPRKFDWAFTTLMRRNFGQDGDFNTIQPWIVPGVIGCAGPVWPVSISKTWLPALDAYFNIDFYSPIRTAPITVKTQLGEKVRHTGFSAQVVKIRQSASQRHGPSYDSPDP